MELEVVDDQYKLTRAPENVITEDEDKEECGSEVHLINAVGAVLSESRLPLDSHPRGPSHTFSHQSYIQLHLSFPLARKILTWRTHPAKTGSTATLESFRPLSFNVRRSP